MNFRGIIQIADRSRFPEHWQSSTVEALLKSADLKLVQDGNHGSKYPKPHEFGSSGVPLITGTEMVCGGIDFSRAKFLKAASANKLSKGKAVAGDVILSHKGSIGKTAIVPSSFIGEVILNPQLTLYRVNSAGSLDNRFLKYYFDQPIFQAFLQRITGISTIPTIGLNAQKSIELIYPSLVEQRKITAILGSLDDKIELNRKTTTTLEEMARALYRSWFVDFDPVWAKAEGRTPAHMDEVTAALFPNSFGDDGLPVGWVRVQIGDLCKIKGGKQLTKDRFSDDGSYPVFGGAGHMGRTEEFNADGYVITVGRVGAYCGNFVSHRGKAWVNNNASHIVPEKVPEEFLFRTLQGLDLSSIKKGAAQPFISNGDLLALTTIFAPKDIVAAFNSRISPLHLQQERLQMENQILVTLRDTLLPKLMSGEIRVGQAQELGSGLVLDHSQNRTVAAKAIAERYVSGHLS